MTADEFYMQLIEAQREFIKVFNETFKTQEQKLEYLNFMKRDIDEKLLNLKLKNSPSMNYEDKEVEKKISENHDFTEIMN